MKLQVEVIEHLSEISALGTAWRRLDGDVPFRSYGWLTNWWQHYGAPSGNDRLCLSVLVVRDRARPGDEQVVGIAPWYAERTRARGIVLRAMGDGEVCSDHVSVLCQENDACAVGTALASHLCHSDEWDRLVLSDVDEGDAVLDHLVRELSVRDCATRVRPAGNCWAIDLPNTWDVFLSMQSKSHRKHLRRACDRVVDTDRVRWHLVETDIDFDTAWPIFVELHQRRRISLGEPGCFASQAFAAFHREAALQLLNEDRLRLSWMELDNEPIAAEYQVAGDRVTYAYQGGIDPGRLSDAPGRLSLIASIRHAIAEGQQTFDFMRGDESYKSHWRAQPRPTCELQAFAPSHRNNWIAQTADWADSLASAFKAGLRPLVSPVSDAL